MGKNKVMFGVPSLISSQSQQLGQNLNLGQEYTPETAAKMQALERRQQLANILIQQGMQPKEARQAGRFVVAPSLWEQAAGPLTTAMGALSSIYLDDQRNALASDEAKRVAAAFQAYNEGTSPTPAFTAETVPGTAVEAVEVQPAVGVPSNLESIIAQGQLPSEPGTVRKSVEDVTNAMAQREQMSPWLRPAAGLPPTRRFAPPPSAPDASLSLDHLFEAAQPGRQPYAPAVETQPAVAGVEGKPDRRATVGEILTRTFSPEFAAHFRQYGYKDMDDKTAAEVAQIVENVKRPNTPEIPRTPSELMAADTALLASGAPGAWPLIQLTKQQREMDLARKENREDRALDREALAATKQQTYAFQLAGLEEKKREADQRSADTRLNIEEREKSKQESRILTWKLGQLAAGNAALRNGLTRLPDGSFGLDKNSVEGRKQKVKYAQDYTGMKTATTNLDMFLGKVESILDPSRKDDFNYNFGGYTRLGLQYWPGGARNMMLEIESLKNALKVEGLAIVRAGGSIGQMTQKEWPIVEEMIENLSPTMGLAAAQKSINAIKTHMMSMRELAKEGFDLAWGGSQWDNERLAAESHGAPPSKPPMGQPSSYEKPTVPITQEEKANVLRNPIYNLGGR